MTGRTLAACLLLSAVPALAQVPPGNSAPQPVPFRSTIPEPRDVAYPGVIQLDVDATDTVRGILRVREMIPVAGGGHTVLLYPAWLPGNHAPRGQIEKLAGLVVRDGSSGEGGRAIPWTRDPVDVYAFHLDVPAGVKRLDVEFQFLSATEGDQGRIAVTPTMISLQPNSISLYPAGHYTRQIPVKMTVTYPAGWTAAGAIPARASTSAAGAVYSYDQANYEVLVDSPILAGRYGKIWPLSPRVDLSVFADTPEELAATPVQIDAHKRLVEQAVRTLGAQQ
jgi:predicted metalloprotease with PDZ domain